MTTKQAYQEKIEAQLKEWQIGIEQLKVKAQQAKADAKLEYEQKLDQLAAQQVLAKEKLDQLKKSSAENWDSLQAEVDQAMSKLHHQLDQFRQFAEEQGHDVLSWAKGIAKEHKLRSIGWAEGFTRHKESESIGWAEGLAEEDKVESEGWTEGYGKEK